MIRSRSEHGEHSTSRLCGAIRGGVLALLLVPALVALPAGLAAPRVAHAAPANATTATTASTFNVGDVIAGVGNGQIERFGPTGTPLANLDTATGSAEETGMCFDLTNDLYTTNFQWNGVSKFDNSGNRIQSAWGSGFNSHPESCVADGYGHVYVGQADGNAQILEFDTAGNLLASFSPAREDRGTDWIDLAADQCTMLYTSEGSSVKRFDVCKNTQLPDFATGLAAPCYALRIRPNGEVMVACASQLYELAASGAVLQTYPASTYGDNYFFAANLDPDGTSVWTAGYFSGNVYKIDIASKKVLTQFNTSPLGAAHGLAIYGEGTAGVQGSGATGGPVSSERLGGGSPSENPSCICGVTSHPIDSFTGNFYHTFTDFAIPGRGVALQLTRTYNAQAAAQPGPLGFGWTDSYNMSLSTDPTTGAVTIQQENGSSETFRPNTSGGYTAFARVLATLVKNTDGTFTFTREQGQLRFTFDANGRLIRESDRNGYATTLTYTNNQVTQVTDPAGRTLTFTYDGSGHITSVTDPIGRTVSFSYDTNGNLVSATDVAGGVTKFTYDPNHLLLTMTDPNGGTVTNAYDSGGRVISQTDAMGRKTTLSYSSGAGVDASTTITDPNDNVTVEQFHLRLRVGETRGFGTPQAVTWTYAYDPSSLGLTTVKDPNGNTWTATWDAAGNLLTSTDPLGRTTTYTYDARNDVTSTTDPLGVTTTYTYDANGNLLSAARPLAGTSQTQTVTLTYGDASHPGDVTAMTDPDGQTWAFAYDANGDRVRASDPLGDTTTYQYNGIGWETAEVAPSGNVAGGNPASFTTSYTRDSFGDALVVTDPLGHKTSSLYDANRNVVETIDAAGHVTKNAYDADDELTQVTRPDGSVLAYAYDADGNQIGQTDGLGHLTAYAYDALDRLSGTADPLGRTTSYGYDGAGNTTSLTDAAGQVTTYTYDAANELVGIDYSDGKTPNVTYTYDQDGRRASMADGTGTTTYSYDSLNRLAASTNGAGQRVGYGYDLLGNLTTLTYPGGKIVARGYDAADRLTAVTDWLGHTTSFAYDANGNLTRERYPNGITAEFNYDRDDGVIGIADSRAGTRLLGFNYTRNDLEQLASATQSLSPTQQSYQYTALNQLSTAGTTPYQYDHGDNLIRAGDATLAYDAADELTSLARGGVTTAYSYDANGNRTQAKHGADAPTTYAYDQENRLIGYASATTSAQYAYDGDGLRASKTVGGVKSAFAWDVADGLPVLLVDGTTRYVYGPGGLPLEQVTATDQVLYFHQDQLGSTRALSNPAGALVATYTYDAYGNVTSHTGAAATPLQFTGQYTDAETGLQYLRARYYDPTTCQFLTRDPLAELTQQAYEYVRGDPLNAIDPSGRFFLWDNIAAGLYYGATSVVGTLATEAVTGHVDLGSLAIAGGAGFVGGFVGEECGALIGECAGAISGALNEFGGELYKNGGNLGGVDWGRVTEEGIYGAIPGPYSEEFGDSFGTQVLDNFAMSTVDPFALEDRLSSGALTPVYQQEGPGWYSPPYVASRFAGPYSCW